MTLIAEESSTFIYYSSVVSVNQYAHIVHSYKRVIKPQLNHIVNIIFVESYRQTSI